MTLSRFRPVYTMLYHLTYRSYTDGRTVDDLTHHSSKSSLHSLVFKLNNYINKLSEVDILGIQNVLLSGNYTFSPLSFMHRNYAPLGINSIPNLYFEKKEKADIVVMTELSMILVEELVQSTYFRQSCYSIYTKRGIDEYLGTFNGWEDMEALLRLDCSCSELYFSRRRLIEKVRPIVDNDDDLVKLISSFIYHFMVI